MRILVFGDSITQGFWDTEGGWVERLRKHYDTAQVTDLQGRDEPTIFNLGISADTSQDVLRRIAFETTARTRHGNLPIVIVQIGVNDSCLMHGTKQVSLDEYKQNLLTIIKKLKPLSSRIIFVGLTGCNEAKTTPVIWDDNFHYINHNIRAYEAQMKLVAETGNIPFIPVFESFMAGLQKDPSILPDGLHPSNAGHQLIVDIVQPKLERLLRS